MAQQPRPYITVNMKIPFDVVCVQCKKAMIGRNQLRCPQCGFQVKVIVNPGAMQGPTLPRMPLVGKKPPKFRQPPPLT